jgi:AraC-like DNA-binding protein
MRSIETKTRFHNAPSSPLGRVSATGFIKNSSGIGCDNMRILGKYALVFLLEGEGFYQDECGTHIGVWPGDLLFILPHVAHCYGPLPGKHWSEFHLIFEGPVFDLWHASKLLDESRPTLQLRPIEYWLRRLEDVVGLPDAPTATGSLRQVCRLQEVLAEAVEYSTLGAEQSNIDWLQQARAMLDHDFSEPLPQVARKMGMSYESFRKKFTSLCGAPPGQHRRLRLMDRACELVHGGEMSSKEIALQLGFCDEFHFSRQFKKVTGCSPREFRRRLPHTNHQ